MIKKNEENKKVSNFKRFSDLSKSKVTNHDDEDNLEVEPVGEPPMSPNLPNNKTGREKPRSTEKMKPEVIKPEESSNENVEFYGKVAKFPNKTKASKAYNFLENAPMDIKKKSSIWYILVEKQSDELQMVKYNYKKGVDLSQFVNDLKTYYISKYKDPKAKKLIESIQVEGNDKFSTIKNIPSVDVDGKKFITKLTEDLIKLLSK
jgi:hypothetical protein